MDNNQELRFQPHERLWLNIDTDRDRLASSNSVRTHFRRSAWAIGSSEIALKLHVAKNKYILSFGTISSHPLIDLTVDRERSVVAIAKLILLKIR